MLQRDLTREERRIEREAKEAAAKSNESTSQVVQVTRPNSPSVDTPSQNTAPSDQSSDLSTSKQGKTPLSTPLRRQSTISLSSLQRPAFPHKLDLSASALRIAPDEVIPSGLSSPVTLAPKSARASVPPDINFSLDTVANGPVDIELDRSVPIDLTGPQAELDLHAVGPSAMAAAGSMHMDPSLGSSADKPIELDFDMEMDMFADSRGPSANLSEPMQGLFDPQAGAANPNPAELGGTKVEGDDINMDMFNSLSSVGESGAGEDIFKSLDAGMSASTQTQSNGGGPSQTMSSNPGLHHPSGLPAPSPGSLMAGLEVSSAQATEQNANNAGSFDFNIDFSFDSAFLGAQSGEPDMNLMDMQSYFDMGSSNGDASKQSTQPS